MMNFKELQMKVNTWASRNFGRRNPLHPLLGVQEEVGELCHAVLKAEQGIRGTKEEHRLAAQDAIGDITIYLADFCNTNGYDFQECVEKTWNSVSKRDWRHNPVNGVPESEEQHG